MKIKSKLLLLIAVAAQVAFCANTDRGMHIHKANQTPQGNYTISWGADGDPSDVDLLTESNLDDKLRDPLNTLSNAVGRINTFTNDLNQIRKDYAIKTRIACTNDFWTYQYVATNGTRSIIYKLDKVVRAPASGTTVMYADGYKTGNHIWAYYAGQWVLGELERDFTSYLSLDSWKTLTAGPIEADISSYVQPQHKLYKYYEVIEESVTYSNQVATIIKETDENTRDFVDKNYVSRYKIESIDNIHCPIWYLVPAHADGEPAVTNTLLKSGGSTSTTWTDGVYTLTGKMGSGWSLSWEHEDGTIDNFQQIVNIDNELTATELDLRTGTIIPVYLWRSYSYNVVTNYQEAVYSAALDTQLNSLKTSIERDVADQYATKTRIDGVYTVGRDVWYMVPTNNPATTNVLVATSYADTGTDKHPVTWEDETFILNARDSRPQFHLEKRGMITEYDDDNIPYEIPGTQTVGRAWIKSGSPLNQSLIYFTTNATRQITVRGDYKLWRDIVTVTNASSVIYRADLDAIIAESMKVRYPMYAANPSAGTDDKFNFWAMSIPPSVYGNIPVYPRSFTLYLPNNISGTVFNGDCVAAISADPITVGEDISNAVFSTNAVNVYAANTGAKSTVTWYFDPDDKVTPWSTNSDLIVYFRQATNLQQKAIVRSLVKPVDASTGYRIYATTSYDGFVANWTPKCRLDYERDKSDALPVFEIGRGLTYDPITGRLGIDEGLANQLLADPALLAQKGPVLTEEQKALGITYVSNGYEENGAIVIGVDAEGGIDNEQVNQLTSAFKIRNVGVAIGTRARAEGSGPLKNQSIAIGYCAHATNSNAIAIGGGALHYDESENEDTGNHAWANGSEAIAIGYATEAKGTAATAIGGGGSGTASTKTKASGNYALATGYKAQALAQSATAIGESAKSTANDAVQIGRGTNDEAGTLKFRDTTIVRNGKVVGGYDPADLDPKPILMTTPFYDVTVTPHVVNSAYATNRLGPGAEFAMIPSGSRNYEIWIPNEDVFRAGMPIWTESELPAGVTTLYTNNKRSLDRLPAMIKVQQPMSNSVLITINELADGYDWTPVITNSFIMYSPTRKCFYCKDPKRSLEGESLHKPTEIKLVYPTNVEGFAKMAGGTCATNTVVSLDTGNSGSLYVDSQAKCIIGAFFNYVLNFDDVPAADAYINEPGTEKLWYQVIYKTPNGEVLFEKTLTELTDE